VFRQLGIVRACCLACESSDECSPLSEAGRTLIEQALPDVSAEVKSAFAGIAPAELEQMADLNLRVLGNLDGRE
jgi:hypothetical protein